jgi:small subunit ribosomal protein S21
MLAITVQHNDVELALRLLKRQLQKSGLLRELRCRRQYEKPSERRRRHKREGIRDTRKRERLALGWPSGSHDGSTTCSGARGATPVPAP